MDRGKVSIIMGVHNCQDTIRAAIDSIINQTYTDWELIICDDGSDDDTYSIINSYSEQYRSKIIAIQNKVNSYLAYSLNHCLEYATGEYIARMDGDDISAPNRLEQQVDYLKKHDDVQLVGTAMQQFDDNGFICVIEKPNHPDKWSLYHGVPFNHATIMTYKIVYDKLNGYTVAKRTRRGQDYDLWFRFFAAGFMGDNISEPLYLVREDRNAIRRRSFKVRWSTFPTSIYGFKLLGYPKLWIIHEFFTRLIKSLIPYFLIEKYKKMQQRN